jgi:hypothetical protein
MYTLPFAIVGIVNFTAPGPDVPLVHSGVHEPLGGLAASAVI